jgi:hypothetical protein
MCSIPHEEGPHDLALTNANVDLAMALRVTLIVAGAP